MFMPTYITESLSQIALFLATPLVTVLMMYVMLVFLAYGLENDIDEDESNE